MIGTTLEGKYRIERLVGAGAMGSVYEGEHTGTRRRVAVKVISAGEVSRDPKLVARFQREAQAAGAIDTQHITQVLDTGVDETGSPYLVMELLHGEDLSNVIKHLGPLPPDLVLRVVAQTCLGVQKAHEAHVVHRDIKPANLFLAKRDEGEVIVKLLDFGIAKVKIDHANDTETSALTKTGSMLGSPLYMSPEQAKGLKSIDHRADLWSLGVVMYQALTGHTPYDHCDALGGLIIAICHEDAAPVQDLAPWVSPEIAAVVRKALQRDPADRYQSAAEMLAAIKPLLPNGWSLRTDMLVALTDAEKQKAAPRLSTSPATSAPAAPSAPPAPSVAVAPAPPSAAPSPHSPASTTGALVQSHAAQPPASNARTLLFAGLAVAASLAVAAFIVTQGPAPAAQGSVNTASIRAKVTIAPADASVEVDAQKAAVKDGAVEITGAPGSKHRVRVSKGKAEVTTDVVVTAAGAEPKRIELPAAP